MFLLEICFVAVAALEHNDMSSTSPYLLTLKIYFQLLVL